MTPLEIIITISGTLIFPFTVWILNQFNRYTIRAKELIIGEVNLKLAHQHAELESKINGVEERVRSINLQIVHRGELNSIKYNLLMEKIEDIENYLEKDHDYHIRMRSLSNLKTLPLDPDDTDLQI